MKNKNQWDSNHILTHSLRNFPLLHTHHSLNIIKNITIISHSNIIKKNIQFALKSRWKIQFESKKDTKFYLKHTFCSQCIQIELIMNKLVQNTKFELKTVILIQKTLFALKTQNLIQNAPINLRTHHFNWKTLYKSKTLLTLKMLILKSK